MAVADQEQDKTEHKSQKKLQQARDRGELPRSQEIATFAVFAVLIVYFALIRLDWFRAIGEIMTDLLTFDRHLDLNVETLDNFLLGPALKTAAFLAPFFLIVLAVSLSVNMAQTGFNIAKERLKIDWERLDPMRGIKKFISAKAWVEGAKSLAKIGLFSWLSYITLEGSIEEIVELPGRDLFYQLNFLISLSLKLGIRIAILMAVLSAADYLYQWWNFQESLKMTHQEVKEELKEHEGDPLVRQRMRSIRMQMARKRMMSDVAKADVIVTNPTHYAVAIAYDRKTAPAPYVCAKGKRYLALRIREIAAEHKIPIIENPPVARSLYRKVKVGQVIPSEFYRVVAEILAFVYFLKKRRGGSVSSQPIKPRMKAKLPPELIVDDAG